MNKIAHYCQKCRAANEHGAADCRNCGTPLMLVNLPRSVRHENFELPSFYENHLLERVSLLEQQLSQMSEVMRTTLDVIREQSELFRENRQVTRDLTDLFHLNRKEIIKRAAEAKIENTNQFDFSFLIERVVQNSDNQNPAIFEQLFKDALKSFENTEEKQAFLYLERALTLDPQNHWLVLFCALRLFLTDKYDLAQAKLQCSKKIASANKNIEFFSQIILADEGELKAAKKFLIKNDSISKESVLLNYALGFIFAALEKFNKAIEFWQKAAQTQPSPEIFYLIGCAFFQLNDYSAAVQEFARATKSDATFADAHFMQCLSLHELNRPDEANKSLQNALSATSGDAQFAEQYRKHQLKSLPVALPFQHFALKKRLLTGGSLRLRKFFSSLIVKDLQS